VRRAAGGNSSLFATVKNIVVPLDKAIRRRIVGRSIWKKATRKAV
jgi:hypothetical protein